jgi:hypothetical protein
MSEEHATSIFKAEVNGDYDRTNLKAVVKVRFIFAAWGIFCSPFSSKELPVLLQ